ncbi:MAG: autotransporter assembly complex protein TamA [Halorhodospira sp.]
MRGGRLCSLILLLLLAVLEPAYARVEVVVEGVEGELADQVRSHVGQPSSEDPAALASFRRRAPERAERGLQAVGYYRAAIEVRRERISEDAQRLIIAVEPGDPVTIESLHVLISGEAQEDPAFAAIERRLGIAEGDRLHHGRYESARRTIQNLALDRGYFDGTFITRRVAVDPEAGTAEVTLHYHSGVRYRFGEVSFSESPLEEAFLQRLIPFEEGDPYTAEQVAAFNRALLDSNYFADVRVRPERDEAEAGTVPIAVTLTARARHEITTGVGYTTDLGPRVRLGWRRPWVNRWGHALNVESEIAEKRQNLSSAYTVPLRNPLRSRLEYRLGVQAQDVADIDTEQVSASVQHHHRLDSGWQQVLSLRAERERYRIAGVSRTTRLYLPGVSWSRTRSRGGLDPSWGDRQLLSLEVADPALASEIELRRVRAATRWVRTLGERHRFMVRGEVGALATDSFADVPPSSRFYAGGDQSVRGYKYQTLGPSEEGAVIGGQYLAVASAEYGYQLTPSWRPAVFIDRGNAYEEWDELASKAKTGAGIGIRWSSPVGPVRLDLASTIGEAEESLRIHFSLGSDL